MSEVATWKIRRRNVKCRLEPIREREFSQLLREEIEATHLMFYDDSRLVLEEYIDRVIFVKRVFNIVAVRNPDEMNRYFVAYLKEEK
jgi:head-tail adaptor